MFVPSGRDNLTGSAPALPLVSHHAQGLIREHLPGLTSGFCFIAEQRKEGDMKVAVGTVGDGKVSLWWRVLLKALVHLITSGEEMTPYVLCHV